MTVTSTKHRTNKLLKCTFILALSTVRTMTLPIVISYTEITNVKKFHRSLVFIDALSSIVERLVRTLFLIIACITWISCKYCYIMRFSIHLSQIIANFSERSNLYFSSTSFIVLCTLYNGTKRRIQVMHKLIAFWQGTLLN